MKIFQLAMVIIEVSDISFQREYFGEEVQIMLEEEVDAERGDVGERRGLLTRSRENGGARKVSNPFQMFWCFQRVKERRGIKLLPWKRSACWRAGGGGGGGASLAKAT